MQTAYKMYKCCRDRRLGNEKSMTYAEFNEDVVDRILHNNGWRSKKLAIAENRRASVKVSDVDSSQLQRFRADTNWMKLRIHMGPSP